MKASTDRRSLLAVVAAAAATTAEDPYLRLVAADHSIACEAISQEIAAHVRIPAGVERPGAVAVHARTLSRLAAHLPDGPIELEEEHPYLHLRFEGGAASLLAADPLVVADFPQFPEELAPAPDLETLFAQVIFACAREGDGRPYLQGVRLDARQGRLCAIASDGHRLAIASLPFAGDGSCTITRRTAALLRELWRREQDGRLALEGSRLFYEAPSARIAATAIAYPYPDIWQLRQSISPGASITLPRERLLEALARASAILTERESYIAVASTRKGATISASSQEGAVHDLVPPVERTEGQEKSCYVQPDYLARPLRALPREVETVVLSITGSRRPLLLTAQQGDLTVEHLVMPFVLPGQTEEDDEGGQGY